MVLVEFEQVWVVVELGSDKVSLELVKIGLVFVEDKLGNNFWDPREERFQPIVVEVREMGLALIDTKLMKHQQDLQVVEIEPLVVLVIKIGLVLIED